MRFEMLVGTAGSTFGIVVDPSQVRLYICRDERNIFSMAFGGGKSAGTATTFPVSHEVITRL